MVSSLVRIFIAGCLFLAACGRVPASPDPPPSTIAPEQAGTLSVFESADGLKGYALPDGSIAIAPRFIVANDFDPEGIALAATREEWVFIDTGGAILAPGAEGWRMRDPSDSASFQIFVHDNGPDEFREGAARYWSHGKMGLFAPDGRVLLEPRHSFIEPVENGIARVCDGCRRIQDGEHTRYDGGVWTSVPINRN